MDIWDKEETEEDIPKAYGFKDVFPKELPTLAPQREIYFEIELIPIA